MAVDLTTSSNLGVHVGRGDRHERRLTRAIRSSLGPLLYVALAFALMSNTWANPTSTIIGNGGDPLSYLWMLRWPAFAIGHGYNPFFSTYMVAPPGTNLAWTGSVGPGILLAPWVLWLGPLLVYNLLATLSLALSAWCAQLAIHRLVPSRSAAIVGGLVFGFSPYMMGHAWGHVTITLAFFPPLILLFLHEAVVRQRWRWWAAGGFAGLILAIQLITFLETIAITLIASLIVLVLLVVHRPHAIRARSGHAAKCLAAMIISFLAFAAYPLWTMLFGAQRLGHGTVESPDTYVNDVLNFVVPTITTKFIPGFLSASSARVNVGVVESGGYVGIGLIIICILATVFIWRHLYVRIAAVTGLILAVLSLGPRLHVDGTLLNVPMPFALLLHLPVIGNVLAARIMGVADLCVGVLVAAFIAELVLRRTRWRVLGILLVTGSLFLIIPAPLPLLNEPYSMPSYFTGPDVQRIPQGSMALVAPYETNGSLVGPQTWQQASDFRFRMPEGYVYVPTPAGPITGPVPTPLSIEMGTIETEPAAAPPPVLSPGQKAIFLAQLRAWNIRTVLVGPMSNENVMVSFFREFLGRAGSFHGGVTAWYDVER
ncbi:MAG: hypothetical protein JWO62_290 [Acidimicrobiaceae bacterium]|nr:hypothetical protein [Acidimicrobiaceae bacterium]